MPEPFCFGNKPWSLLSALSIGERAGISGASYYEGSFSNIQRSPAGDYVAVSSRGNFFLTWSPGQTYWQPHNRPTCVSSCR